MLEKLIEKLQFRVLGNDSFQIELAYDVFIY